MEDGCQGCHVFTEDGQSPRQQKIPMAGNPHNSAIRGTHHTEENQQKREGKRRGKLAEELWSSA